MDQDEIRHCQLLRDSKGVLFMCWDHKSRRDSGLSKVYYRFAHPMPYAWEQLSHPVTFVKTVPLETDVSAS